MRWKRPRHRVETPHCATRFTTSRGINHVGTGGSVPRGYKRYAPTCHAGQLDTRRNAPLEESENFPANTVVTTIRIPDRQDPDRLL
jgi:hypothetical protein